MAILKDEEGALDIICDKIESKDWWIFVTIQEKDYVARFLKRARDEEQR